MSFQLGIGTKVKKLLTPSTLKIKSLNVEERAKGLDSERKQVDFGNKDETFVDSQEWLDSDCEDDFVSVNGDSAGRLNCEIKSNRTQQMNKVFSADHTPGTTSADTKRRLAELLQENQVEEQDSKQNATSGKSDVDAESELYEVDAILLSSRNNTLLCNDGSASKDLKHQNEKKMKTRQCCLPSLVCRLSFKERKQKMSHVH